jgi:hypothetical protein
MIWLRVSAIGITMAAGVLSGCTEEIPVDPRGQLVMTLWTRELLDAANTAVPFSRTHIARAAQIWSFECFVPVYERKAGNPISIIGGDVDDDPIQLGQQFYSDIFRDNIARVQLKRVRTTSPPYSGHLGTNVFSTRQVLLQSGAQTAKGVTEPGANASVVTNSDSPRPWDIIMTHELGHQLNLGHRTLPSERDQWVMFEDADYLGTNLSGWDNINAPSPEPGSECERARSYGSQQRYLLPYALNTEPEPLP